MSKTLKKIYKKYKVQYLGDLHTLYQVFTLPAGGKKICMDATHVLEEGVVEEALLFSVKDN